MKQEEVLKKKQNSCGNLGKTDKYRNTLQANNYVVLVSDIVAKTRDENLDVLTMCKYVKSCKYLFKIQ